jgi:hypothetical protein
MSNRLVRSLFVPLLVYILAALFITWPLATQITTHTGGGGFGDSFEYVRLGWWGQYAITHGLNPFYQSLLAYPEGFFSTTQWMQPLIYWPTALLNFLFSPTTAFNLWLLIEIVLSGLTAYCLCREVVAGETSAAPLPSTLAALIGGLIFMAFPAIQGHLSAGHVNPLSNYAIPPAVLYLYRIVTGRSTRRSAIVGALALWILAIGNFTFPVFVLLPIVLFGGGYLLIFGRGAFLKQFSRPVLLQLMMMFGLSLILILPFYIPTIVEAFSPNRPAYLNEGGSVRYSTDPLAFVALSPFAAWTQDFVPQYSRTVLGTNSTEGTAYLGVAAVLFSLVALTQYRRRAGLWLAIALGCMIFSLGPLLKWNDQPLTYTTDGYVSNIVLPWAIFQNLPLISLTRTPGRFNMTTGLAFGVLAALGLAYLLSRLKIEGRMVALTGIAGAYILLEYQLFFPFPMVPNTIPGESYFRALAARSDVRAVFDVPLDDPIAQKMALYQQTLHHKPLIAGYVSRRTSVDPAKLGVLEAATFGTPLITSACGNCGAANSAILNRSGINVVVYHRGILTKLPDMPFEGAKRVYQDDQIAVFEVPPSENDQAAGIAYTFVDWWTQPDSKWLSNHAQIYVYSPEGQPYAWAAAFTAFLKNRSIQLKIDGQVREAWPIGTSTSDHVFYPALEPGFHTLEFITPDGCTPIQINPQCMLDPHTQDCALPPDQPQVCLAARLNTLSVTPAAQAFRPMAVHLGQGMTLTGVLLPASAPLNSPVQVTTNWQADQKLPGDYHLFVHVLDSSGKLIAQADTVPGAGTYPTTLWNVPQTWSETVELSKIDTPGTYSVYTGWYRYPDLTRLTVWGDTPHAIDGLIYLGELDMH